MRNKEWFSHGSREIALKSRRECMDSCRIDVLGKFGRCVATLFDLLSNVSCFLRKAFRKEESISKKYFSKKVFRFLLRGFGR